MLLKYNIYESFGMIWKNLAILQLFYKCTNIVDFSL